MEGILPTDIQWRKTRGEQAMSWRDQLNESYRMLHENARAISNCSMTGRYIDTPAMVDLMEKWPKSYAEACRNYSHVRNLKNIKIIQ